MNRALGIGLVVVGVLLVAYGVRATDSFASDVSRFFTGSPTDKSVWLMLGGIACVVVGVVFAARSTPQGA
jgi:uncharacterized membrane protein YidH (DUF202 family)